MISNIKKFNQFINESNSNKYIFYHTTDSDIESFTAQLKDNKLKRHYLFFSIEPNAFMKGKFVYTIELDFNPSKIFNTFEFITDCGIRCNINDYDIKKLLENNLDYFYDIWENGGVDSPMDLLDYYISDGGDENDKIGLLYYFITKCNDSWIILETDIFLKFIESKGFEGFVTVEEGLLCLALKKYNSIKIINKQKTY